MMKKYSEYLFGDILVQYRLNEADEMSLSVVPAALKDRVLEKPHKPGPLAELHARGDRLPDGYGNGHTLAGTSHLKFISQVLEGDTVVTTVGDGCGRTVYHRLRYEEGLQALRVSTVFENTGDAPVVLNLLSSLNLGGITPFTEGDAAGALYLHRILSMWSAEGRLKT